LSSRVIAGIAIIIGGLFCVFGEWILGFLFGNQYEAAYLPLVILTVGQLGNALFGSVGALLNMTGHERDTLSGMFVALLANLLIGVLLIPDLGMVGAAIASACSFA